MLNWKGLRRKQPWPNFRYYPCFSLERLRKTTKTLSQYSRSPGRDLNPGPPKHEAGVFTTRPRRSASGRLMQTKAEILHWTQPQKSKVKNYEFIVFIRVSSSGVIVITNYHWHYVTFLEFLFIWLSRNSRVIFTQDSFITYRLYCTGRNMTTYVEM
jgi:hypothetical protein